MAPTKVEQKKVQRPRKRHFCKQARHEKKSPPECSECPETSEDLLENIELDVMLSAIYVRQEDLVRGATSPRDPPPQPLDTDPHPPPNPPLNPKLKMEASDPAG